jgi:hypothetical protein
VLSQKLSSFEMHRKLPLQVQRLSINNSQKCDPVTYVTRIYTPRFACQACFVVVVVILVVVLVVVVLSVVVVVFVA